MGFDLGELLKDVPKLDTGREQIEYIHLDLIDEDPNNFYQLSDIEDLAANIQLCGLQQPIRVRPTDGGRYRIVSGHRRRKAVELLAAEDPQRWQDVPCIIETDDASPALQQLRLIYANANTRKMTDAEISEQAQQVEKLLYQLKEDGYEFPGRMRDHVAQAVGQSKSKLARLKVIREKLSFSWKPAWRDGKLAESVAYELAQLPAYHQDLIFAGNDDLRYVYAETVREYARRFGEIDKMRCGPRKDMVCTHKATLLEKSCKDRWSDPCRTRCCLTCPTLTSCKTSCQKAAGKKAEMKASAKAASEAYARQAAERDKPTLDIIRTVYSRVGAARKAAGVSVETLFGTRGKRYGGEIDRLQQECLENGTAKLTTNTTLPFGCSFYASDAAAICKVADLLQVSVDYLLGRTDEPAQAVPSMDTGWSVGTPDAYGTYVAYIYLSGSNKRMLRELLWTGDEWLLYGQKIDDDATVICWTEQPEEVL